jgi:hypothetical protein
VLESSPEVTRERERKARLTEQLDTLRRHRSAASLIIPVRPVIAGTLPAGVGFGPGRMTIEFAGVEDLFAKLFALAQVASGDLDAFRTAVDDGDSAPLQ